MFKAKWHAGDLHRYGNDICLGLVSVHDHAINLQAESWRHLLIIGDSMLEQGPAMICLVDEEFAFFKKACREGVTGNFSHKSIEIKSKSINISINWRESIELSFAPVRINNIDFDNLQRVVSVYKNLLTQKSLPTAAAVLFDLPGGESYFRQQINKYYPELVYALQLEQEKEFLKSCRNIIGMGRGLTPTGDDLIHGALLTYHYFSYNPEFLKIITADFRRIIITDTNIFGAHMLELGLAGLTPKVIISLLNAIAEGRTEPKLLDKVITIGSCSGYDIAIAMIYFIEKLYV